MVVGKNGETSVSLDLPQKKVDFFLHNELMKQLSRELTFTLAEIRITLPLFFPSNFIFSFIYMYACRKATF